MTDKLGSNLICDTFTVINRMKLVKRSNIAITPHLFNNFVVFIKIISQIGKDLTELSPNFQVQFLRHDV